MTSPQERRIVAIVSVIGVVIAFLAWIHPFAPRPSPWADVNTGITTTSSEPLAELPSGPNPIEPPVHSQNSDNESHLLNSEEPPTKGTSGAGLTSGGEGGAQPHINRFNLPKPKRACDTPETATLRPGNPARVASGLAILSVRMAREGSEPYLTLSITSDRDTLAGAVLDAPAQFHFKTSLGTYFVNVSEVDLAVGAMNVQVGCEAEGNTP
jgi:hypothetical protein